MLNAPSLASPFHTDPDAGPSVRRIADLWASAGIKSRNDYPGIRAMLQSMADAYTGSDGRRFRVTFNAAAGLARTRIEERAIEVSPSPILDTEGLPDLPSLWAVLTSWLAHETTHDRYWRSYRKAMDAAFGAPGTALRTRAHVYDNVLQDIVGEALFVRDYPGYRGIFRPMLAYIASKHDSAQNPMRDARPVDQCIAATRYAEWQDWTGCEAERDWWQAWATRWSSGRRTTVRWVAAIREALAHDAKRQRENPKPEPEQPPTGCGLGPQPQPEQGEDEGDGGSAVDVDWDPDEDGEPEGDESEGESESEDEDGQSGAGKGDESEPDEDEDEDASGSGDEPDEDEDEDEDAEGAGSDDAEPEDEPEDDGDDADDEGDESDAEDESGEDGEDGDGAQGGDGAGDDGDITPADADEPPTQPTCPTDADKADERQARNIEEQSYVEPDYIERPSHARWPLVAPDADGKVVAAVAAAFQRSRTGDTGYDRGYLSGMLDDRSLWRIAGNDGHVFGRRTSPEPGRYNVFVMVDTSGSMGPTQRADCSTMSLALALAARHQPNLRLTMYAWASGPVVRVWGSGDPLGWTGAWPYVSEAGGGTHDARALRWAGKEARRTSRPGEQPIIFFLSDGDGDRDLPEAVAEVRRLGVVVVGVSIGADLDKSDAYGADWVPWQGSVSAAAAPLAAIIARVVNPATH